MVMAVIIQGVWLVDGWCVPGQDVAECLQIQAGTGETGAETETEKTDLFSVR